MTPLLGAWPGPLSHDFFRQAFFAGTAAAVAAGLVGAFLVLRNQVFAADSLSHVAFTGGLAALAFGFAARTGVVVATLVIGRPLLFASIDPGVAEARGVPVRILNVVFLVAAGIMVAQLVQVVGALLLLGLITTPAATAQRLT